MKNRLWVLGTLFAAAPAFAGPHDFVIVHGGTGGTAEQAAPYVEKFLGYVETALGWPKGAEGRFFPEVTPDVDAYLEKQKPGFGMLDAEQVLALKARKVPLQPIATVVGKGQSLGHLTLVAKDPAIATVDALRGKRLASSHLGDERFLARIVFDGKLDPAKHFAKLDPKVSMLKAVKAVMNGDADAALVSDEELAWLKTSPYAALKPIWTSAELPPVQVVAFTKNTTPKDKDALAKLLLGMCGDPKGGEVCKALNDIEKFAPPATAAYDVAAKRYAK